MHCILCDLSEWEAAKQCVQKIGPIDLLVNNAGIGLSQPFFEDTQEDYDR